MYQSVILATLRAIIMSWPTQDRATSDPREWNTMEIHFQLVCQTNPLNCVTTIFKIRIRISNFSTFLQFFEYEFSFYSLSLSLFLSWHAILSAKKNFERRTSNSRRGKKKKMFLHTGDSRETVSQSVGTRLMRCVISVTAMQYRDTLPC